MTLARRPRVQGVGVAERTPTAREPAGPRAAVMGSTGLGSGARGAARTSQGEPGEWRRGHGESAGSRGGTSGETRGEARPRKSSWCCDQEVWTGSSGQSEDGVGFLESEEEERGQQPDGELG